MFRAFTLAPTEQEGSFRLIVSVSFGELVIVAIVPPWEQKLLKCRQKRVKWIPCYVVGDFSGNSSSLFCSGYSSSIQLTAPPVASSIRRAVDGENPRKDL